MSYSKIKRLLANPSERRYYDKTYAIGNEFGIVAIAYANCERDALDEALDAGRLDSDLIQRRTSLRLRLMGGTIVMCYWATRASRSGRITCRLMR
jgi:hypothetical protein